ncbi:MAG: hypothetical protein ACR2GB_03465, partial [Nocardioidaceae bacterium]
MIRSLGVVMTGAFRLVCREKSGALSIGVTRAGAVRRWFVGLLAPAVIALVVFGGFAGLPSASAAEPTVG